MDHLDQDIARFKKPAIALAGGAVAAVVIATMPVTYLETVIGMTGIAELVDAAAPPLGSTAKSLIALAAGLVSASLIFIILDRKGEAGMGLAIRKLANWEEEKAEWEQKKAAKKSKFSLGSLKKILQKPQKSNEVKDLEDLPKLRESDKHPDAPARQPIFAEKDLGSPLTSEIKPFEDAPQSEEPQQQPAAVAPQVQAATPAPFVMDKSLHAPAPEEASLDLSEQFSVPPVAEPVTEMAAEAAVPPVVSPVEAPAPVVSAPAPTPVMEVAAKSQEDLSGLSIAQLTERLESGLGRLQQLEQLRTNAAPIQQPAPVQQPAAVAPAPAAVSSHDAPVGGISVSSTEAAPSAAPAPQPVASSAEDAIVQRQADMDAALKAALGTLEKMTAHR